MSNLMLAILWRLWRMRRTIFVVMIVLSLLIGGSTISIVSHEPTMQNNNRDTVDSLSQPAQQNWSTVWPSLPDNMTHKGSCTHTLWNTFITALTKQYQVIDKAHLRGTLSMEDQRNINKTLTVLAHSTKTSAKKCLSYLEAGYMHRTIIRKVLTSTSTDNDTVTFVTQLSYDRFDRLEIVLGTWKAPVSAAVYIPVEEVPGFIVKLCKCKLLENRNNVDIHLVIKDGEYYPMNLLRNVALNGTRTVLSYLSDVDFIPASDIAESIGKLWQKDQLFFSTSVIVVPAFEMMQDNYKVPQNKQDILQLWKDKKLIPAREEKWPKGHLPTDYQKWKNTDILYPVRFSEDYEPYIVIKTSLTPQYSERFVERYKDKSQQLLEVWARGFKFLGLGTSYAIHYPHGRSLASASDNLYKCAIAMNNHFQKQLLKQYKLSSIPTFHS